jgi:hypothetical protein
VKIPKSSKNPEYQRKWFKTDQGKVGSKIPAFTPHGNDFNSDAVKNCKSPMDYFLLFQPPEHINKVVEESRRYGVQQGMEQKTNLFTPDSYLASMGVILLSGYCTFPRRKMYWEESADCRNALVAENIRRDTCDAVLQLCHFVNNENLEPNDRFAKIRPIFDNLNQACLKYVPESEHLSVDEIMIPYYGPHGDKQYIRYSTVQYSTVQYSTVQYSTVQYSTVQQ